MNASQTNDSPLPRRLLTIAMLGCFAMAGWFWHHESNPKSLQARAATTAKPHATTNRLPYHDRQGAAAATSATVAAQPCYVTKNIEDIRAGDYVLAREEHGEKIALRKVVEVYRRQSYHLRHLTFESDDGETQTLQTTDEHPFWSVSRNAWVNAGDFQVGEQVTSPTGHLQTLTTTHRSEHPDGFPVFNFQVEGWHSYFVSSATASSPVLAHNADCLSQGSFSIINWTDYPANVPKPTGPFRVLEGAEYQKALEAKTKANKALHAGDETLKGLDLHEIHPVKFGGSPTDITNKIALTRDQHIPVTTWWARLLNKL